MLDNKTYRLAEKQDFIHVAILVTIALAIGVYLIATTILINKDGVLYIEQARNFLSTPSLGLRGIYPPGYPFLIYITHRIVTLISDSVSVETWIYSAQSISLLCRILSMIPLYFIGKLLVGPRNSYLALLILVFLPYPAEYGSEIVREWPHIFFLAAALLFLIYGSIRGNWRMFAAAGLFAGLGYMIRPECVQIVGYGILWLLVGLFIPRHGINKSKAICLTVLLIIGFLIPAVPYSIIRGEVLPPKLKDVVISDNHFQSERIEESAYIASVMPKDILKAFGKLTERICENLMYFFMPPLVVGLYYHFRKPKELLADGRLFISALAILYAAMMIMLHINFGYISRRHFMPMIVFTAFYIPAGLLIIADWISGINIKGNENKQKNTQKWFFILLTAGMLICFVKLSGITGAERKGYREAAKWLKKNTSPADIIAVPDTRIAFYAERKGMEYENGNAAVIPASAAYIVKTSEAEYHKVAKSDKNLRYNTGEIGNDNESDTFLSEIKKCSPLKGLVGYWAADNDSLDFSIYRNHAMAHGSVSYTASECGQAFNFIPNTNSYIDCGNNSVLNPIDSITLSVLIYPVTTSFGTIIAKNGPYCMQFDNDGKIITGIYAGSPPSWAFAKGDSVLSLNAWHHVITTYDGSHIKIYIDGKIDGPPLSKSGGMPVTYDSVRIGYGAKGFDYYFNGLIDEVMLFNTALQLDKIKALNEMVKSRTVPTFGSNVDAYPVFDRWEIERECSFWMDEQKNQKLCIYKIK